MKKVLIHSLFLLFVILQNLNAQIKIHKNITVEDGLLPGEITDMHKDSYGYIWIATLDGLSRWDGKYFQNYTTDNGLAGAQVLDIEEGPDSTLYFSTFGYGITLYKDGSFDTLNTIDGLVTNFVSKVYFNEQGRMYIGAGGELFTRENETFKNISKELNIPPAGIRDIREDSTGEIYVATFNGLIKIKEGNAKVLSDKDGLNVNYVTGLVIDPSYVVYASTNSGCNIITGNRITSLFYQGNKISTPTEYIIQGIDNKIYLGSELGLFIIDNKKVELIDQSNGLVNNRIGSLLQDENGVLYIGTKEFGVSIYKPGLIENFNEEHGLINTNITAVLEDKTGRLFLGTKAGVYLFDQEQKTSTKITSNIVNSIRETSNGNVFIAAFDGLKSYNNGVISKNKLITSEFSNRVFTLQQLNDGRLLVGKMEGLFILDGNKVSRLTKKEGLPSNFIQTIIQRKNGKIVVGTHGSGAAEFNDIGLVNKKILIEDGIINCLFESSDSALWIGTDKAGVVKLIRGAKQSFDSKSGLLSNKILGVVEDHSGRIYISTPLGVNIILRINGKQKIRTLTETDGLISNDCNNNSLYCDSRGIVWIGTKHGLSKYDPEKDLPINKPPKVYLTGMEIFNVPISLADFYNNPTLNFDENYIRLNFSAVEFYSPHKIKYSYRLSGVDKDWVDEKASSVQYTSLDDGNYTFEVKAATEWGQWGEQASLNFQVLPAWWETWWFRSAALIFLVGLLWFFFRLRLNYLLKLERLRTKIASDLHDELGSLLTQISMNAELLLYNSDSNKIKEKSGFISSKVNEVMGIMSDVIWSIDSRNDNFESLIDRAHHFVSTFLKQKEIEVEFINNIYDEDKTLKIDFRQNIMMIIKEAVNNAVKHSGCSKIIIEMSYKNRRFDLLVSDNGKGLSKIKHNHGNGIRNINMRAASIKAEVQFLNNNGLTILLTRKNF